MFSKCYFKGMLKNRVRIKICGRSCGPKSELVRLSTRHELIEDVEGPFPALLVDYSHVLQQISAHHSTHQHPWTNGQN